MRDPKFSAAKDTVRENLETIQLNLKRCVDEGMADPNATYYNELLDLIDEAELSKSWGELEEVIAKAKILEVDVDAFLSLHGRTTISLPWPRKED